MQLELFGTSRIMDVHNAVHSISYMYELKSVLPLSAIATCKTCGQWLSMHFIIRNRTRDIVHLSCPDKMPEDFAKIVLGGNLP